MGQSKLCLLLLLSTYAFAQQGNEGGEEQTPACLLETKYRNFRKYVYQYEAEAQNGVSETANGKNGSKVTCKVDMEVPQACSFVLRTEECSLSEVSVTDAEGLPVYQPSAGSDAFKAAMEKNPLRFVVGKNFQVSLYPEPDEPTNILNVKRGIISGLLVPVSEESGNMPTIHGQCRTEVTVNERVDIPIDVTITRDLNTCKGFQPMGDYVSPLALISRMNTSLSKLISSNQSCDYKFDNRRKHMTKAICTEKHLFLPFFHQDTYGITSHVKQTLTLLDSGKINNRYFDFDPANMKLLTMDYAESKAPAQSKDGK